MDLADLMFTTLKKDYNSIPLVWKTDIPRVPETINDWWSTWERHSTNDKVFKNHDLFSPLPLTIKPGVIFFAYGTFEEQSEVPVRPQTGTFQ